MYDPAAFDRLVDDAFSADARVDLELRALTFAPVLEPLTPDREALLGYFDGLLEAIVGSEVGPGVDSKIAQFIGNLLVTMDLDPSTTLRIKELASFMTLSTPGKESYAAAGPGFSLSGEFTGVVVGHWFDIPPGIKVKDPAPYRRDYGLLFALQNAQLWQADQIVAVIDEPWSFVPLNHGKPELYRVT